MKKIDYERRRIYLDMSNGYSFAWDLDRAYELRDALNELLPVKKEDITPDSTSVVMDTHG